MDGLNLNLRGGGMTLSGNDCRSARVNCSDIAAYLEVRTAFVNFSLLLSAQVRAVTGTTSHGGAQQRADWKRSGIGKSVLRALSCTWQ